jgi:hypothetical protein
MKELLTTRTEIAEDLLPQRTEGGKSEKSKPFVCFAPVAGRRQTGVLRGERKGPAQQIGIGQIFTQNPETPIFYRDAKFVDKTSG